jgi:putative peptidoglycan lipid II flippase
LIKEGLVLTLGILLGRVLGFARELILLKQFGTSLEADILIAIITLPDIVVGLFVGSALPAVFLKRIQALSEPEKFKFFLKISFWFVAGFVFFNLILTYNIEKLAFLIFPSQIDNSIFLSELSLVIWTIPFLALNSVTRMFLQSKSQFLLIGLENVIFNFCIITALFVVSSTLEIRWITISLIIGSFLRWLFQLMKLWSSSSWSISQLHSPSELQLSFNDFKLYGIAMFTGLLTLCVPYVARSFSSALEGVGAISTFNYAYKFVELPVGLTLTLISTVLYPKLTQQLTTDPGRFKSLVVKSHAVLILALPLSLYFFVGCFSISYFEGLKSIPLKFDLTIILNLCAIGFLPLFLRLLNELYVIILVSYGQLKKTLYSSILATNLGLLSCYFLSLFFGLRGTFAGIGVYYLLLTVSNLFFTLNLGVLHFSDFFSWSSLKNKLIPHLVILLLICIFEFLPFDHLAVRMGLTSLGTFYLLFAMIKQLLELKRAKP